MLISTVKGLGRAGLPDVVFGLAPCTRHSAVATRRVWLIAVFLAGHFAVPQICRAQNDSVLAQTVAESFLAALRAGDSAALSRVFADTVTYDGEGRVISVGGTRDAIVLPAGARVLVRNPDEPQPDNFRSVELTGTDVGAAFARLVATAGVARWQALLSKVQPSLTRVSADGEHYAKARQGDYVYDLHFREANKGKRAGLDEAMLFVLRPIGSSFRVVALWVDL